MRVMITFLEFYEVLMKYTLFKLYHTQGLRYPPTEDQALKEAGCFLLAIKPTPIDAAIGSDLGQGTMGMIESNAQGMKALVKLLQTYHIMIFFYTVLLDTLHLISRSQSYHATPIPHHIVMINPKFLVINFKKNYQIFLF